MTDSNSPDVAAPGYVEQYVVFVEQTAHVTDQRAEANRTFITINAALLAGYGFVWEVDRIAETVLLPVLLLAIAATGIVVTLNWRSRLRDYKRLLNKRFQIIMAMEENLPAKPYVEEARLFEEQASKGGLGFSMSEHRSTWAFSVLHVLVFLCVVGLWVAKEADYAHGVSLCGWFKPDGVELTTDRCAPIEREIRLDKP